MKRLTLANLVLASSLIFGGCIPSLSPEPTPTFTSTPTKTVPPTETPLPTPDPLIQLIEKANQTWLAGNVKEAISQYKSILSQTDKTDIRETVFSGLIDIGMKTMQDDLTHWFDSIKSEDQIKICENLALAHSALWPVISAKDRPGFNETDFYLNAAKMEVILNKCAIDYVEPRRSLAEGINTMLDLMNTYPDEHDVRYEFTSAAAYLMDDMLREEYEDDPVKVRAIAKDLTARIGDDKLFLYDYPSIAAFIDFRVMESMGEVFCSEKEKIEESPEYLPSDSPATILICQARQCKILSDLPSHPEQIDLSSWEPDRIEDVQLILCRDQEKQQKKFAGSCNYRDPNGKIHNIPIKQIVEYYNLYVASTGQKIKSMQIPGEIRTCPMSVPFTTTELVGSSDNDALFKNVSSYLQIPIPSPTPEGRN